MSVEDLRKICKTLTDERREYKINRDDEMTVAISYNDGPDDLNAICFTFPAVANLNTKCFPLPVDANLWPFGEDGLGSDGIILRLYF